MDFIKNFAELVRFYAIGMTISSCLVIYSYAHYSEKFTFFNFILLVFALTLVHLGANLFDDYTDVKRELKKGFTLENINFCAPEKALLIRNKTFSMKQVEIILVILFSISLLIGIYFALNSGWQVLLFALLGGLLVLFYPISSKYTMSEITVGLIYGPLMIIGGYYALCSDFNSNLALVSSAIFFTTLVLLHTHNIMDWEFDVKEGKNTLAIQCKTKEKAIYALKWIIIISYGIIFWGVLTQRLNPKMLYVLLTLPIATKLLESIKDYINIKDIKFEPRWYWGMFENWEEIKRRKFDYFMFRFYLARNYAFFFALFASIGAMI